MESAAATPPGGITAPALVELACRQPGPFASVYLATEAAIDNASQRSQARWKSLRDRLEDAGVPQAPLRAIDQVVPDAHRRGNSLGAIANSKDMIHVEYGERPEPRDRARWSPLPDLLPIVRWRQDRIPFVAILTDRTGADLFGVRLEGPEIEREVEGSDFPISKVGPGGWSQRRYQQRAENTWEHNAHDVAEQAAKLAGTVDAKVVILSGDVRAVSLVREALPERWRALVRQIHRRVPESAAHPGHLPREVEDAASEVPAEETAALIEHFHMERGQEDRAADGPEAVLEALRRAQVEVLLVADDPDDDRTAWFGPAPTHVGARRGDLEALGPGAGDIQEARLVDVLVRGTLGTGGGVRVVPRDAGPKDDVGAILRWSAL
ncbi:MAG: Vms1/Ankzf1 family peptidyl-tRNA hydrolase [Actinomycetota bacterium]